jgi:hypothetical protein
MLISYFCFKRMGGMMGASVFFDDSSISASPSSLDLVSVVGGLLFDLELAGVWDGEVGGGEGALADRAGDGGGKLCGGLDADGRWDGGVSDFGVVV